MSQNINNKFRDDKESCLNAINGYLNSNEQTEQTITREQEENLRQRIGNTISSSTAGNLKESIGKALETLEELRDAKTGVIHHKTSYAGTKILMRDARGAKEPPVRSTEAFEMQYLNAIRAAIDVAEISGKQSTNLEQKLKDKATDFINDLQGKDSLSQKGFSKLLKKGTTDIGYLLEQYGVADAYHKLNIAKDFQNFNDTHHNVATISKVGEHVVVEAEVAMKGLTSVQKGQYKDIITRDAPPSWYTAMPEWEQKLTAKYAPKIVAGEHVIPTQLRQIAGMKNAFEKITAIHVTKDNPNAISETQSQKALQQLLGEKISKSQAAKIANVGQTNKELKILHTSKHAGTLASFAADKNVRQQITNENAKQAQEWIGVDTILHANTLNSGPVGAGKDPKIVKMTNNAMKEVGAKHTNTAFNAFRRFGGAANKLTGAKDRLKDVIKAIDNKDIQSHLKPRSAVSRLFGINKPKGDFDTLIENYSKEGQKLLKAAKALAQSVEKAGSLFDKENASLATSTNLSKLNAKINNCIDREELAFGTLIKQETLVMCASGKDRTGLAQHDQSAQAIANELGIKDIRKVDKALLNSGHTAQQAGGLYAGGATIGCFGTKNENKAGLPESRKESLESIVEISANSNKIKGTAKLKEIDAPQKSGELVEAVLKDSEQNLTNNNKSRAHSETLTGQPTTKFSKAQIQEKTNARRMSVARRSQSFTASNNTRSRSQSQGKNNSIGRE